MNRKILDCAVTVLFCVGLTVASNIQEKDTGSAGADTEIYVREQETAAENGTVTAGVSQVISEYSFTTESDEEKSIEKKQVIRVAEPEDTEASEAFAAQTYSNRWNITLTQEEIDLLARIVWLESGGEPQEGQEAVVEVVFNRMASDAFPDSLYDVLSQNNPVQFCSWKNRDIAKPTDKEYQSIYQVLQGNTNILRNDTLYFSREPLTSRLDVEIGAHSFCY